MQYDINTNSPVCLVEDGTELVDDPSWYLTD